MVGKRYLAATCVGAAADTRHTVLPTSSAISSAPLLSTASPTGRPKLLPARLVDEAGDDVLDLARRAAVGERHEGDLVAGERCSGPSCRARR